MKKQVTIVGVGALGSHVALFLRNEANLRLIDFDRVEYKNTLSQFHSVKSTSRNKALALEQSLSFLFGDTLNIASNTNKLTKDNVLQLLKGSELIIDCVDNAEARRLIQEFAYVPCLHGALDAQGSFGRVGWNEEFSIDEESAGAATCEGGEFLPFIVSTAAFIARAAQKYLQSGVKVGYMIHPGGVERT